MKHQIIFYMKEYGKIENNISVYLNWHPRQE